MRCALGEYELSGVSSRFLMVFLGNVNEGYGAQAGHKVKDTILK
jgi:hypothetical protein